MLIADYEHNQALPELRQCQKHRLRPQHGLLIIAVLSVLLWTAVAVLIRAFS